MLLSGVLDRVALVPIILVLVREHPPTSELSNGLPACPRRTLLPETPKLRQRLRGIGTEYSCPPTGSKCGYPCLLITRTVLAICPR